MATGKARDRLEHDVAMATRDLEAAEAAVRRSTGSGDRPPNEAAYVGLEVARAKLNAAQQALADYDKRNGDSV
ncbi:hypothetical protein [Burkholderia cepacia]|uniref:hypothetical protein n=1 Tax=Burkholderia cepacia TaxID=292 RepID=UPI00398F853C